MVKTMGFHAPVLMMNILNNLRIGTKLNLYIIGVLIVVLIGLIIFVNNRVANNMDTIAQSYLEMTYEYINTNIEGDWRAEDGVLYKGDTEINENYELVDAIAEMIGGGTATIFLDDTRVSTNVQENGERAIGTVVSDEVKEVVLENEENFFGEAYVVGEFYHTGYMPIRDADENVVGIWYIGLPEEQVEAFTGIAWEIGYGLIGAILLISVVVWLFSNRLKTRFSRVTEAVGTFGKGDFTIKLEKSSNDELGEIVDYLGEMRGNLTNLIDTVNQKSEQVAASSEELTANMEENKSAAEEVSKAVENIAEGANNQAEKTEEISNTTDEFGKMINDDQTYVKELSETAESISKLKEEGVSVVEDLTQKTEENNKATETIYNVIKETKESADSIGEATNTITDIAEQTNLLALNASIEAARAGEYGEGFAVVADEIRKLAENANENSERISNIVEELSEKSQNAVTTMEEVAGIVQKQTQGVRDTESKFNEIAGSIQKIKEIADSLNETGRLMQDKKMEIINNIHGLASIASENSSSTEEISSSVEEQTASMNEISNASEQLAELAEELQTEIAKFKY